MITGLFIGLCVASFTAICLTVAVIKLLIEQKESVKKKDMVCLLIYKGWTPTNRYDSDNRDEIFWKPKRGNETVKTEKAFEIQKVLEVYPDLTLGQDIEDLQKELEKC